MKRLLTPMIVFCLGVGIGLAGWHFSPSAKAGYTDAIYQIIQTTTPGLYVKLKQPFNATHKLNVRWTYGSDTKATLYMEPKEHNND